MIRTQHPSNNHVLGAPAGWDQGDLPCSALPITVERDAEGHVYLTSYWQLSDKERAVIAEGGLVKLTVVDNAHPVVAIGVGT